MTTFERGCQFDTTFEVLRYRQFDGSFDLLIFGYKKRRLSVYLFLTARNIQEANPDFLLKVRIS
nr:MAG TPA: hypothetical protein [Caudoviricetes sp.]